MKKSYDNQYKARVTVYGILAMAGLFGNREVKAANRAAVNWPIIFVEPGIRIYYNFFGFIEYDKSQ